MTNSTHAVTNIVQSRRNPTHAQVSNPALLAARTAELRRDADELTKNVTEFHSDSEEALLERNTENLTLVPQEELLSELADKFGMAWAVVAQVVGVSPAAVRKWRRGENIKAKFHHDLARFVAFCRLIQQRDPRIGDVGHWLELPVASGADISRLDIYIDGAGLLLLQVAGAHITGAQLLDQLDPEWRDRVARARRYKVLRHDDGTSSIVEDSRVS